MWRILSMLISPFILSRGFDRRRIKNILISRECCIGDVLMTTPLVRSIRMNFPAAQIDYMLGDWSRDVLNENPYINRVLEYATLRDIRIKNTWQKLMALRKNNYDLIFIGDVGFAPILTAFLIGAPYRVGFDANRRGFLLTHKVLRSSSDKWHETRAYLKLISVLGLKPDPPQMDIFLSRAELDYAERFYAQNNITRHDFVICLFPGGGRNPGTIMLSKLWGEARYAELADKLIEKYNACVIILGGPGDVGVAKKTAALMKREAITAAGIMSFRQTVALIKLGSLFIGNDCGLMHAAAAAGTPTISIFGPTDPQKLAPLGEAHVYVKADVDCSPCYRQTEKYQQICQKFQCMERIQVADVLRAFDKLAERGVIK